jgi:hypothetical protein
MPFDIKQGLTQKVGPLPAFAWGGIVGGAFLLYRHFHSPASSTPSAVAVDSYGTPAADLGQTDNSMDPSGLWPGGYGVGGSTGIVGNVGDPLNPSDNSGTSYPDPYSEYLSQQNQMLSDFLGALPQTWGIGDTPLQAVVSHDVPAPDNSVGQDGGTNPTGAGGPPPGVTPESRLPVAVAKVPSLQEFISSHPAENKTVAQRQRLTQIWQSVFGARYAAYVSASNGQVQQSPMSLTGGGAPPPRTGVAPAYQPVQQNKLPVAPPASVPAPLAPSQVSSLVKSIVSLVTPTSKPVSSPLSGTVIWHGTSAPNLGTLAAAHGLSVSQLKVTRPGGGGYAVSVI